MRRGFFSIFLNSFSPIKCRVESFNGQWMEMKSDSFRTESKSLSSTPPRVFSRKGSKAITFTPKHEIFFATSSRSFHIRRGQCLSFDSINGIPGENPTRPISPFDQKRQFFWSMSGSSRRSGWPPHPYNSRAHWQR